MGVASTSAAGYDGPVRIRPYRPDDAPGVASLWQYWFRGKSRIPDPGLIELVQTIFGENPNKDPEVTPLVATAEDGGMLGFLGVTVTPVLLDKKRGTLACIFPSVVDPNAPTTLASFLMRKSLAGPQVFTFSDGGDVKFSASGSCLADVSASSSRCAGYAYFGHWRQASTCSQSAGDKRRS